MDIFIFALRSCMGGRDMIQLSFPKASSVAFWCMSTSSLSVRFSIGSSLRGSSLTASSYPSPALSRVAHGMASLVSIFSFLDSKRRRKPSLERPARVGKCAGSFQSRALSNPLLGWFQVQRNIRRACQTHSVNARGAAGTMAEASQNEDIADILAEASQMEQDPTNIVARLKRAYVNEKNAPELLPFETDLLAQVMAKVEDQELVVQQNRDAAAAAGGGGGGGAGGGVDDLMAHIYHAELNRVRFLIRAYYRTRLFKIEKYAVHTAKDELGKLSPQEVEYAEKYVNMLDEHFGSVLNQMPEKYTSMLQQIQDDDTDYDMIPEPNLDKHVFCRVREDRRDVMFDPNDPDNTMDLDQGDIIMVRYRFIKGLLEDGALDLI